MKKTELLNLPIYDSPDVDVFDLQDWNTANQNIEQAYEEMHSFKEEMIKVDANAELVDARKGKENLGEKISEIDSQLEQKAKQVDLVIERNRIDNIVAVKDSVDNLETADIRVGADGKTYKSAGEAVRKQVKNINGLFEEVETKNKANFDYDIPDLLYPPSFNTRCAIEKTETGIKLNSLVDSSIGSTYVRFLKPVNSFGENKTIYFKANVEKQGNCIPRFACRYVKSDGTMVSNVASEVTTTLSFTTPTSEQVLANDYKYLAFEFYLTNGTSIVTSSDYVLYSNIQIETDIESEYIYPFKYSFKNYLWEETINNLISKLNNIEKNNKTNTLKIMSFNIGKFNYGINGNIADDLVEEKLTNWRKFLGKYDLDVLAVQEFNSKLDVSQTMDSNVHLFNYLFSNYASHFPQQLKIYSKNKILTDTTNEYLPLGVEENKRGIVKSYIELNNGIKLCLINCHLSYMETQEGMEIRQKQINDLITILEKEKYFVLFGDFNANYGGKNEFNSFIEKGYNLANGGYFGWERTFNYEKNYTESANKGHDRYLDNIITSSNIKIRNVEVVNEFDKLTSDHLPIYAEIEINN